MCWPVDWSSAGRLQNWRAVHYLKVLAGNRSQVRTSTLTLAARALFFKSLIYLHMHAHDVLL